MITHLEHADSAMHRERERERERERREVMREIFTPVSTWSMSCIALAEKREQWQTAQSQ